MKISPLHFKNVRHENTHSLKKKTRELFEELLEYNNLALHEIKSFDEVRGLTIQNIVCTID